MHSSSVPSQRLHAPKTAAGEEADEDRLSDASACFVASSSSSSSAIVLRRTYLLLTLQMTLVAVTSNVAFAVPGEVERWFARLQVPLVVLVAVVSTLACASAVLALRRCKPFLLAFLAAYVAIVIACGVRLVPPREGRLLCQTALATAGAFAALTVSGWRFDASTFELWMFVALTSLALLPVMSVAMAWQFVPLDATIAWVAASTISGLILFHVTRLLRQGEGRSAVDVCLFLYVDFFCCLPLEAWARLPRARHAEETSSPPPGEEDGVKEADEQGPTSSSV